MRRVSSTWSACAGATRRRVHTAKSPRVGRKADGERIGRWNCHACHASFIVLASTIFQKTHVPLQKWFLAISLMLNAKKGVSSHQLVRDLDLNQKTAWRIAMCIRRGMTGEHDLLSGIVEADECYVGGKPRKRNRRDDEPEHPRGRGTRKLPVIGAVARGGDVVAEHQLQALRQLRAGGNRGDAGGDRRLALRLADPQQQRAAVRIRERDGLLKYLVPGSVRDSVSP